MKKPTKPKVHVIPDRVVKERIGRRHIDKLKELNDCLEGLRPNRLGIYVSDGMLEAVIEIGKKDHRRRSNVLLLLLEAGIVAYRQHGVELGQLRDSLTGD